MKPFSRRGFLLALPALAVGAELLVPKKTIFLPPRGGWFQPSYAGKWAVKMEGGYYFSDQLYDLLRTKRFQTYPIFSIEEGRHFIQQLEAAAVLDEGSNVTRRWCWEENSIMSIDSRLMV